MSNICGPHTVTFGTQAPPVMQLVLVPVVVTVDVPSAEKIEVAEVE